MPRVHVPDGPEVIHQRVLARHQPAYLGPWTAMKTAVTIHSILPWRVRELVRYRVAHINGCLLCQGARAPGGEGQGFTEEVYAEVTSAAASAHFSEAEKLAVEYTERFAQDHHSIDDAFFERLHAHFSEAEIVDLTYMIARHMAFGRFTHVLGLDDACETPAAKAFTESLVAAE